MDEFDGIEREVGGTAELALIWLHGLGADAGDFEPIVAAMDLPAPTRFVFPNAPTRPVTINAGLVMRAWYDIVGFGPDAPEDLAGLRASAERVRGLVEREVARGLSRERIVLVGFSQGGAVVLHAGLGAPEPLGGIIGLSTYLPAAASLAAGYLALDIPVLLAHGSADPVIPLALAEQSARRLVALGVGVDWAVYPMGHEVSAAEVRDIGVWLGRFGSS